MQQYVLHSLQQLQAHLSQSRQLYQVVDNHGDAYWQHQAQPPFPVLSQQRPLSSAKSFFFAEQETLYVFDGQFFRETIPKPEPFVLFGVQSCDLMAIHYQDIFFEQDPYYQARRQQALLVGVDCVHPCQNGFCNLVDAGPGVRDNTADLILHPLDDDRWLLIVVTEPGRAALQGLALTPATGHAQNLRSDNLTQCEHEFDDHSYILEGIEKLNRDQAPDAFWQQLAIQCIACSGCTTLCPTCSCYGTQNQAVLQDAPDKPPSQARQVRFWDSCLYEGFQREASLHHPAEQAGERVKRFWYHKFSDDFLPEFGRYGCVGCGRCEQTCPGVIGVHSVMKRIVKDA
ncbi:4Fe-4S dicluster domain-containing protein [Photobacterium halotolerans]|uniref:4Fe-4S ferredoxin-type domain-containing protein n=1 Tax=Photobacterium halotolerans TaxID=265726 RepID=A0A0F5VC35_9GAMM|nr:4Fe-4S dicluster domain-containing protein [Photobacterium halotolerans]KKC99735.1 hypothetical protein KY46_10935 [Photobacterium halotolerans]